LLLLVAILILGWVESGRNLRPTWKYPVVHI